MKIVLVGGMFLISALLAACGGGQTEDRLPASILMLYGRCAPGGVLEIEAARDGRILEAEVTIPISELPPAILAAAKREAPEGTVIGAELEFKGGKEAFEVQMQAGGLGLELIFDASGKLLEKEVELKLEDAPVAVLQAAEKALPESEFKSVERVEREGKILYHVKRTKGPDSYKIVLTEEGAVQRKAREMKAEIEIPIP